MIWRISAVLLQLSMSVLLDVDPTDLRYIPDSLG